ncbi:chorismate-binding protein [Xanthovirga aplysinae]|uniref:chorismate-binding protein n=1 Tax=Xanthovirga aplysinae TaxID=2529853 RepID=UPI0012BD0289|nr:chorismate-binding protein [Xanthovirga aplysinae]MTI33209.1 isochorismate synthase [Xanthovirga aplysinae]
MKEIIQDKYISDIDLKGYSEESIFNSFLHATFKGNFSISFWRNPLEKEKHLVVDLSGEGTGSSTNLQDSNSGFLFSAFDNSSNNSTHFINADLYFGTKEESIVSKLGMAKRDPAEKKFRKDFQNFLKGNTKDKSPYFTTELPPEKETNKRLFINTVTQSIKSINSGNFQKVVPAKTKVVPLSEKFKIIETFQKLCSHYPNAFVSLVSIPNVGTWMGATPELLVNIDQKQQIFKTVALAGTQIASQDLTTETAAWRQKEIEEQAMVGRYIINCFKKIRLREYEEIGPRTIQAGNLLHLKSEFKVNMKATNFPELGSVMLDLLHPTSAVCGMPKEPALDFLKKHEPFDREYYSGFLGPVNIKEVTSLFVNLRCMKLVEKSAVLFAGAGVTANSNAEKEWDETELKCNTLLKVLKS